MNEFIKSLEDKVYAHAHLQGRLKSILDFQKSGAISAMDALKQIDTLNKISNQENWAERVLKGEL